ncbi:hypothetical protein E4U42_006833 [Claviceps africana]|uniref:Uncharacterized protein n=1 Tax=Claviceps africana TaxID=83212 RepID=A0A8K0J1V0_9HYPO|nr:hypothetical protein E4U42_006833 [Claviceps africana]
MSSGTTDAILTLAVRDLLDEGLSELVEQSTIRCDFFAAGSAAPTEPCPEQRRNEYHAAGQTHFATIKSRRRDVNERSMHCAPTIPAQIRERRLLLLLLSRWTPFNHRRCLGIYLRR